MSISSIFSILPKIINILDINISNIEKMESRFKIARKINNLAIIPLVFLTTTFLAYKLFKLLGNDNNLYIVVLLILLCTTIEIYTSKMNLKKEFEIKYNKTIYFIFSSILVLLAVIFYFTLIMNIGYSLFYSFSLTNGSILILSLIGFYFIFKIIYPFIFVYPLQFSTTSIPKPILKFTLSNNSEIEAILINITRKGDYIVKNKDLHASSNNELTLSDKEILIHKTHIVSITYLGELPPLDNSPEKENVSEV
ncbi:hypothetical protein QCD85_17880 [Paenibacillus sp. PsM32]|uniref:hypothetical protein n=1 Tax=Paenibacillus sp. PsM32 TaxID=3030536 RepID=UPI00263B3EC5|nr:hypothetical protein [Paenibacillus sp. PsM32]MDN4619986.1 hypothetical protein [Paenibacillus sp. PsM32]